MASGPSESYVSQMTKGRFRAFFVLGPLLFSSIVPLLVFGVALDQWGSNVIWGSVFGLGWCLAAFAFGNGPLSSISGFIWGWFVLLPLYSLSGCLWGRLAEKGRNCAVVALLLSFLIAVPAKTILAWEQHGVHLPDYSLHLATVR